MGRCYFCKGDVKKQRVIVDYRWGDDLVVINHVPADVCTQCGERYYDAKVSRKMEEMVMRKKRMSERMIKVPVREFVSAGK